MRAHNERLLLSELRGGPLSRAQLTRRTGLSAQTISQIARSLLDDGLLRSGQPTRGRVGQPSVPLSLAPDGAWFAGLTIGRRSAELVLMDFCGSLVQRRVVAYHWPEPQSIVRFVSDAWPSMTTGIAAGRLHGLGIAQPFFLWEWAERLGAPAALLGQWRDADIAAQLTHALRQPVYVENDASAACGAELTFGSPRPHRDFAYLYVGWFIGGGLVLDGALHTGARGNAGAFGPLRVSDPQRPGHRASLLDVASIRLLESALADQHGDVDAGSDALSLSHEGAPGWTLRPDLVEHWIDGVADALSQASLAICSVLDVSAIVIDGPFPIALRDALVARTRDACTMMDTRGLLVPDILPGSLGSLAPLLGAARQPLFARFLLDQAVLTDINAA